ERGFAACHGRYLAVLEGDDRWIDVEKLEAQARVLDEDPDLSFVFTRTAVWFEDVATAIVQPPVALDRQHATFSGSQLALENFVATFSACMYRRDMLARLEPRVFATTAYDWLVNLAMSAFGPIGFMPRVMTAYRVHQQGAWSGRDPRERLEHLAALIVDYDDVLDGRFATELARHRRSLLGTIEAMRDGEPASGPPAAPMQLRTRSRTTKPRGSVIMAAHNHDAFVEEAVQSVLDQTVDDVELVVVDDGSTDETAKKVASVADDRVRFFRLFPAAGACAA